eukprot:jgi/Chrzof1/14615/Cz09g09160.t1_CYP23
MATILVHVALGWLCLLQVTALAVVPALSDERVVFQTKYGDIELAFYPEVAPVTVAHIFKLVVLGAFTGNHIFRVDKGFVAQVADVVGGRTYDMNHKQKAEAGKTVPLEVKEGVKHVAGVLSMGRYDDPNSRQSSFSFLLGDAPHLDMKYTIFGQVTSGMITLHALEGLEVHREGIFVMPKERITILSSYWYLASRPISLGMLSAAISDPKAGGVTGKPTASTAEKSVSGDGSCRSVREELDSLRLRFNWQAEELQRVRRKCLPGR